MNKEQLARCIEAISMDHTDNYGSHGDRVNEHNLIAVLTHLAEENRLLKDRVEALEKKA